MFDFDQNSKGSGSKCYVTHGVVSHVNSNQLPTKKKPYSSILEQKFLSKVEIILRRDNYEPVQSQLLKICPPPEFKRLILPLSALLEGQFFNEYIKKGDVLMLSEGRQGIDNVYFLKNGILTLALDKESYERSGLVGQPDGPKGKRGTRPRWRVEINLRLPSMLHGKKGFDRVVYAFKNVLTSPVTWLFANKGSQVIDDPLQKHFPTEVKCSPQVSPNLNVKMPSFTVPIEDDDQSRDDFDGFSTELYEWLSMVLLETPRINVDDDIDPYLSRYQVPQGASDMAQNAELVKITWHGFITPQWAYQVFIQASLATQHKAWFAFGSHAFNTATNLDDTDVTILVLPGTSREYLLWEVAQP